MPVIVVGADTPLGRKIVPKLLNRGGEVRAFVSSRATGDVLKQAGAKVAVGDLSDGSHIAAAAYRAFTAVLVESAIGDGRELAFAEANNVPALWYDAIRDAGVQRAVWIDHAASLDVAGSAAEVKLLLSAGRTPDELAEHVADLNDLEPETRYPKPGT